METITFTREIQSDTLVLPELRLLIGRTVEITIRESIADLPAQADRWKALRDAAGKGFIDPDVCLEYREFDKNQQRDPL